MDEKHWKRSLYKNKCVTISVISLLEFFKHKSKMTDDCCFLKFLQSCGRDLKNGLYILNLCFFELTTRSNWKTDIFFLLIATNYLQSCSSNNPKPTVECSFNILVQLTDLNGAGEVCRLLINLNNFSFLTIFLQFLLSSLTKIALKSIRLSWDDQMDRSHNPPGWIDYNQVRRN